MDIRGIKIDTRTYDFDAKITEVEADLTNSKAELNTKIQKVLDDLSAVKDSLQSGETYNINITGNAATATNADNATTAAKLGMNGSTGTPMTFNWSGQGGQPSWLWGGNDGSNMYVYSPSNFSVNTATTATTAYKIRTSAPSSPENGDIWIG